MARIKFNSSTLTMEEAFEKFLFAKNAQGVTEKTLIGYAGVLFSKTSNPVNGIHLRIRGTPVVDRRYRWSR